VISTWEANVPDGSTRRLVRSGVVKQPRIKRAVDATAINRIAERANIIAFASLLISVAAVAVALAALSIG
jgi:hypothetical protein